MFASRFLPDHHFRLVRLVGLSLAIWTVSACANSTPESPPRRVMPPAVQPGDRVPGEYIVILKAAASIGDRTVSDVYAGFGSIRVSAIGERHYLLKFEKDPGLQLIKQKANEVAAIESVQPNFLYRTQ